MWPSGDRDARILLVGEAPGAEEDHMGEPFVGPVGRFLRIALEDLGMSDDVVFTNAVKCRPPENKTPSARVITVCSQYLQREIEHYDPKAIILMGNVPLKAMLNETGITKWRGTPFFIDDRLVLPTFHPSYVRRRLQGGDQDTLNAWISDLEYAANAVDDTELDQQSVSNIDRSYQTADTEKKLKRMVKELTKSSSKAKPKTVAFDTEVSSLDAKDAVLLCVSFATLDGHHWVVPVSHKDSVWVGMPDVPLKYIGKVLSKCNIVGHNLKFDFAQMLSNGIDITNMTGDSMILSSLIDSKRGLHSLKRLAAIHLWMGDYDAELEEYKATHPDSNPARGGSYANIPGDILFPYAALDAIATVNLYDVLLKHPDLTLAMRTLHDQVLMPASRALGRMEAWGFPLDMHMVERYDTIYTLAIEESLVSTVEASPALQRMTNDRRLGIGPFDKADANYIPNLHSYMQTGMWLYDYMELEVLSHTETGAPSTSKGAVAPYLHLPEVASYRLHKLYRDIYAKYVRTAVNGEWTSSDGRVRSTFNINGAITGRLSSSKPNMQNIPTPEKEPDTLLAWLPIKNLFTASPGRLVMQADYSGMELRTFASLADCEPMKEAFYQGIDIHSLVTSRLYHVPVEEVTKELRYRGKWVNWTILFGGDSHTLNRLYGIPHEEGNELMQMYFDMFPEVKEFHTRILEDAEDNGFIHSIFGRRYYVSSNMTPDEKRTILNFPVQSAASDVLVMAMAIIDSLMNIHGLRSRLMNTVHDSVVTDVVPEELDIVCHTQRMVMENIKDFAADYMPGIDLDWITVPLVADIEVGTHYGVLERYEPQPRSV